MKNPTQVLFKINWYETIRDKTIVRIVKTFTLSQESGLNFYQAKLAVEGDDIIDKAEMQM